MRDPAPSSSASSATSGTSETEVDPNQTSRAAQGLSGGGNGGKDGGDGLRARAGKGKTDTVSPADSKASNVSTNSMSIKNAGNPPREPPVPGRRHHPLATFAVVVLWFFTSIYIAILMKWLYNNMELCHPDTSFQSADEGAQDATGERQNRVCHKYDFPVFMTSIHMWSSYFLCAPFVKVHLSPTERARMVLPLAWLFAISVSSAGCIAISESATGAAFHTSVADNVHDHRSAAATCPCGTSTRISPAWWARRLRC